MRQKKKPSHLKRNILLAVAGLLVVAGILFVLEKKDVTNFIGAKNTAITEDAKTTSTAPTAQDDFTDGGSRDVNQGDDNEGTVQDTSGTVPSVPPQDQWTVSADQKITAYTPSKNAIIKKGDSISGASTLPKINFRLIDDASGVIAQGTLTVEKGKFSGTFDFTTTGSNGRLDLFTANADGVESSVVEIPVRFK